VGIWEGLVALRVERAARVGAMGKAALWAAGVTLAAKAAAAAAETVETPLAAKQEGQEAQAASTDWLDRFRCRAACGCRLHPRQLGT